MARLRNIPGTILVVGLVTGYIAWFEIRDRFRKAVHQIDVIRRAIEG